MSSSIRTQLQYHGVDDDLFKNFQTRRRRIRKEFEEEEKKIQSLEMER